MGDVTTSGHNGINQSGDSFDRLSYLNKLQEEEFPEYIPAMIMLLLVAFTGLVGNTLVLIVYSKRYKRNPTRIFIMFIAGFDLVANTVCIPGDVYDMFYLWTYQNPNLCRFVRFANAMTTITSASTLLALSISRYKMICKPFENQMTERQAKIISVCIAIFGVTVSIPFCILNGLHSRPTDIPGVFGQECTISDKFIDTIWPIINNGLFLLIFLGVCTPLVTLYVLIGVKAYAHNKARKKLMASSKIVSHTASTATATCSTTEENISESEAEKSTTVMTSDSEGGKDFNHNDGILKRIRCCRNKRRRRRSNTNTKDFSDFSTRKGNTNDSFSCDESNNLTIRFKYLDSEEKTNNTECVHFSPTTEVSMALGDEMKSKDGQVESTASSSLNQNQSKSDQDSSSGDNDRKNVRKVSHAQSETSVHEKQQNKEKRPNLINRTTGMLIIITSIFVLSYFPNLILTFFKFTQPKEFAAMSPTGTSMYNLFLRTYFINSGANAIVYSLCDVKFRSNLKDIYLRCIRVK